MKSELIFISCCSFTIENNSFSSLCFYSYFSKTSIVGKQPCLLSKLRRDHQFLPGYEDILENCSLLERNFNVVWMLLFSALLKVFTWFGKLIANGNYLITITLLTLRQRPICIPYLFSKTSPTIYMERSSSQRQIFSKGMLKNDTTPIIRLTISTDHKPIQSLLRFRLLAKSQQSFTQATKTCGFHQSIFNRHLTCLLERQHCC